MEYRLQTEFYEHRCRQMFDIIVDFPESMGALLDMRVRHDVYLELSCVSRRLIESACRLVQP